MIYIFNAIIVLLCLIPILCCTYFNSVLVSNYFKNHSWNFFIKLLFISMFIYFIIHNFKGVDIQLFIITGYVNFFVFHILEGIVSQKKLLK